MAFSPDGKLLATANRGDDTVSMFTVGTDGALAPVSETDNATGGAPYSVAFSPNGTLLATANSADSTVSMFTVGTGGTLTAVTGSPFATGSSPYSVAFSPDGTLLATANHGATTVSMFTVGTDGTLTLATGSPVSTSGNPTSVAFSPDGTLLAVAIANGTGDRMSMFNVGLGGALTSPVTTSLGFVTPNSVAFSPDGTLLATANLASAGTVSMFTVGTGGTLASIGDTTTGSYTESVAFSSDGTLLATANGDGTVSMFTVGTGGTLTPVTGSPFSASGSPTSVAFSPDGTLLATANSTGNTVSMFAVTLPLAVPDVPAAPSGVAGDMQAVVTVPVNTTGGAVAQYTVTSTPDGKTCTITVADLAGGATSGYCTVTGLTDGTPYTFTATATNASGTGAASTVSNTVTPAAVSVSSGAGGSSSTDSTPSPATPVIATVTSPSSGQITFTPAGAGAAQPGYSMLGHSFVITAPPATAADPLRLSFMIDNTVLPGSAGPSALTVFRDGVAIQACAQPDATTADPDPCVTSNTTAAGVTTVTVLSSHASTWTFGTKSLTAPSRMKVAGVKGVGPGGTEKVAVRVWNSDGTFAGGVAVTIAVTGANKAHGVITTNAKGFATFSYTPAKLGVDTVTATAGAATGTATVHIVRPAQRPVLGAVSRHAGTVNIAVQTHPGVTTRKVKVYAVRKVRGHKASLVYVGSGMTNAKGRAHVVITLPSGQSFVLKARMAGNDYTEHLSARATGTVK